MIDSDLLYREYYPKVSGYVRARVPAREDAEDIVSGVFMKVFSNLDRYNPQRASVSTWIYAITRNAVIDYFNRRKQAAITIENLLNRVDEQSPGVDDELLENLNRALGALTETQRDAIILRYYFGLGHKEISVKLGVSYINARKICSLAVAELRKMLIPAAQDTL